MSSKPFEEQNDHEITITEQREDFMVPPSCDGNPTFRTAHFLKPLLNPNNQPLPKTPFPPLTSNPNLAHHYPVSKVCFMGSRNYSESSWKSWVDELQNTHQSIWKKVGIFDAIKCSTYHIKRDNKLIESLAEKWCCETNTFVFSWGECTVTLEDVMILGGFSVMGDSVSTLNHSKKFEEIKEGLVKCFTLIYKKCNNNLSQYGWMDYFKGKGGDIEHVAFLVFWLSRFVFHSKHQGNINRSVFDVAISLALGTKIALAPAVLASIYRDLTLLKERIACQIRQGVVVSTKLVLCAPFHLLQLWAWERFSALSPKPNCLVEGEPRAARWHKVTKLKSSSLRSDIESHGDGFIWRPYAVCLKNWNPKHYCCCDEGMWVVIDSEVDEKLLSFVRCLRASELVGLDCVMQYLPHRVGMQFGLDQDIPNLVPRSNADFECAWSSYDKPLEGLKLYIPPRLFEGDVTMQYAIWWRQVSALGDDALITCPRRKRSVRKRKSINELMKDDMESQNQLDVLNNVVGSSNGLDERKEANLYDAYTIPEEDKSKMVNEHAKGSNAQDTEAMGLDVVGSGSDKPDDISSFFDETIEPQTADNEATHIGLDEMVNLLIRQEDEHHECAMEVDEKKEELTEIIKDMCKGGNYTEHNGLIGEGPSINAEVNTTLVVGDEGDDGVQEIAKEDANIKQMTTSMDDIVVISDEEDTTPDCAPSESFYKDFKFRINNLSNMVSTLKAKIAGTC